MKKYYVMLFTFTSILIAGMLIVKQLVVQSVTAVSVYEVQAKQIEDTITCTGSIQAADCQDVYVDIPCVAGKVNVKAGDDVEKGDLLFTVDVEATKEVLASVSNISSSLISKQINQKVTAPVSGKVSTINVAEGEAIDSDTPCAVISSSDTLQVKVAIYEDSIKNVKVGQTAVVTGQAFQNDRYTGTVTYISSSARQKYSGTSSETVVDALITLTDSDDSVKPGLTAKTKIQIGTKSECIIVPYDYVMQDDDNQEYVFLYKKGRAVKCNVETGKEYYDGFEIVSGLSSGDLVIKNPDNIQKSGISVTLRSEGETENE